MRQEPLTMSLGRIAYTVSQGIRFSWFYSQYMAAGRRVDSAMPRDELPANLPDRDRLIGSLFDLFRRDYRNIEQGYYRMPHDMWPRPDRVLRMSRRFFRDLETVDERRKLQRTQEIYRRRSRRGGRRGYPRYYLQNFHYQSDGYLSDESAVLYDYQVEVLFHGGADAMRRQALVPLHEFLQGREMPRLRLLDVACGTGRFLSFVKDNHPSLPATGLDLSPYYLRRAAGTLRTWRRTALVQGNAERIPLADKSCDLVSCLFLFHELPRKTRVRVANEIGRVLRPGGRLLFLDSIQRGDAPDLDPLLDYFPLAYHEPYYTDYTRTDLEGLFRPAGLRPHSSTICYLSKLAVFHKPRAGRRSG